jgi:hypothetical protein
VAGGARAARRRGVNRAPAHVMVDANVDPTLLQRCVDDDDETSLQLDSFTMRALFERALPPPTPPPPRVRAALSWAPLPVAPAASRALFSDHDFDVEPQRWLRRRLRQRQPRLRRRELLVSRGRCFFMKSSATSARCCASRAMSSRIRARNLSAASLAALAALAACCAASRAAAAWTWAAAAATWA